MDRRTFVGVALASPVVTQAVNVDQFGVEPGRDEDMTGALQRAVDAGVGDLFLPKGTYRVEGTVEIRLDETGFTSLFGMGGAKILKTGPGPAFLFRGTHQGTAGPSSFEERVWQNERMPLIAGIEIEGDHPESVGIELFRTMQATLTNLLIRRCRVAVHLSQRNRNFVLSHCHLYHNRDLGVWFDHVNLHQAIVANCHISYSSKAGIKMDGGEIRNLQISGNDIEYNYDNEIEDCADVYFDTREAGSTFREATIIGNTIQARTSPGGANVRFLGGEGLRSSGMMAITGNMIGSQTDNIHLVDCRGVSISGNYIYSAADRSIRMSQCDNVVVNGNSIDWNPDYGSKHLLDGIAMNACRGVQITGTVIENSLNGSEEAGGAVEIAECEDVSIDGCQILDSKFRGVTVTASKRCRISNSTVVDRMDPPRMLASIEVDEQSSDILASGNFLQAGKLKAGGNVATRDNHEVTP